MGRSGYSTELDYLELGRWRGRVASAMRGKRGQALLRDLVEALDAMPSKRLIADELQTTDGEVCALGALGIKRGIDMSSIDPHDPEQVAPVFNIAECMAQEIVFENDEAWGNQTPEQRWEYMRRWAVAHIKAEDSNA